MLALHDGRAGRNVEFGRRIENRQEAAHDEIVDLLLGFIEDFRQLARRHDGVVIRNLFIVENAFVGTHPALRQNFLGKRAVSL